MTASRWKRTEGNAAVEFGLVLPVLLIILLGIIDWGQVHFTRMTMTNAAREGARVGVTQSSEGAAKQAAEQAAATYLQNSRIEGAQIDAEMHDNERLEVEVSLDFDAFVGFVPTPDRLRVESTMRWELAAIN